MEYQRLEYNGNVWQWQRSCGTENRLVQVPPNNANAGELLDLAFLEWVRLSGLAAGEVVYVKLAVA